MGVRVCLLTVSVDAAFTLTATTDCAVTQLAVCCAAFILHRLLLQLKEPEEAAKIKVPTGKKVQHRLNMWWSELEPRCYYLKEEDGVCQSPRPDSRIGLRSLIDLKSAHGGLYMGVHYDQSQFYFVRGTSATPVTTPKGITVNEDPKGAWASLSIPCDENILPAIQAIEDATAAG
jgi:hypothetical protein